jgi:hypothetical protein
MEEFNLKTQRNLLENLTEPFVFVKSYNGVVRDLNELGKKYSIDISNCIRIERGNQGVAFRITEAVNLAGVNAGNLITEIFIAMHKNHLLPLEFVFVETEVKEVYKFIKGNAFLSGDSLSIGSRIIKVYLDKIPLSKPYYQTLEDLANFDAEFLELKRINQKWSATITKPENIINAKDFVVTTNEGDENSLNALLLMHSISGSRERKHFTGIHHLELPIPSFIKEFIVTKPPDKMEYMRQHLKLKKAMVELYQKRNPHQCFQLTGLFNNSILNVTMHYKRKKVSKGLILFTSQQLIRVFQ